METSTKSFICLPNLKGENVRVLGKRSERNPGTMFCRFPNCFYLVLLSNHNFVGTHFEFLMQNLSNTQSVKCCKAIVCFLAETAEIACL